mmetsp:Transcript_59253/g.141200  ORF Transcript_59253/g.141200 Transcript_59253/m.141200 type:complete len:530 (+) Transcript_59253:72-1661(+)|eukprot:CAMPEP_0181448182 /NCGR_PEP_ID=MMETSP1110-20121109/27008_1 /TAXON_ID=174948 /ORGANISM="Symbiodinium sp., Strain CCMP421" /LENGTH=529 /DNA_ID=CAMNT_0023572323 /DNA_START=62 /DNA_END=1651 /DNA_ORIENTATION=-
MSYYKEIEGVKLDKAIIEACEKSVEGKGDGRVSMEDAQEVFKFVKDAGKVTETELWTVRFCLTEFNFTEAAADWITAAVKSITKYADKVAKGGSAGGYYETVDGVKCDHEILELCRKAVAGAGDGRVSKDDAKGILDAALDAGKVTDTERWTLRLCLSEFNWTEAAHDWFTAELKAAGAPLKRPASMAGRPAKKAKVVDPTPSKVKCVVGAIDLAQKSGVSAEVCQMVSQMAKKALPVAKEERHAFQGEAFSMVEKMLAEAHEGLKKEFASAGELIANADTVKAARDAKVKETEAQLETAKEAKTKTQETSLEKTAALKASHEPLHSVQAAQKEGDAEAVALEKEKKALEESIKELPSLKEQGSVKARPMHALTKALAKAGLEDSLVETVHLPLQKKPEARGSFDNLVLEKLSEAVDARLAEMAKAIEDAGPARAARAEKVAEAQAAFDAAKAASEEAAAAAKAAKEAFAKAQDELATAKKSQGSFDAELRKAAKTEEAAKAALEAFVEGPLADFKFLVERSVPAEETA